MIKIDKHNIEAYYLDYLEGNLSVEDTGMLLSFIDNNPEFAELFADTDDLLSIQLQPSTIQFGDVDDLKTLPCSDDEICLSNIDYWLIAKAEKTLSISDVKAVDAFVIDNNLEKSEAYIGAAFLKPDLTETFGDVGVLKKEGGTIIPLLLRFTSVAAIFLFMWLLWNPSETLNKQYASRFENEQLIDEVEYVSPETTSEKNVTSIEKTTKPVQQVSQTGIASTNMKQGVEKLKSFTDFPIFQQSIENINVPIEFAFNNPPKLIDEDINISAIFSEYEETIANNSALKNNDFAQVNSTKLKYELEEQYKPVTKRLSNLTSLNMSVQKMPEASDISQTVIQIGKFSFERKKKK